MFRKIRSRRLLACAMALILLSITAPIALAQSTATLQGSVTDPHGAVVPNAKVTAHNEATGIERTTQTDSSGNYQIAALPVGTYRVEVEAQGFQKAVISGLALEVSQTVVENLQLRVGGAAEAVTVTAEAPVVETVTITVGQVLNQKTVQEIPLNGRHFMELGLLIPGSVTPPQNGFLTSPIRGQGSLQFNTAGAREDTVNFMVNGVNLNDMVQNQITFQPSIDTIQEFKVDNSTYSAEYGRNSGAIVNIATRSGTNSFHGEAFEFIRNNLLDARNFFDKTVPPFKRNQFGGALGGPILKNRAFFFFSYEGLRQRQGLTVNSGVISDADRANATDPAAKKLLELIPRPNAVIGGGPGFQGAATAPVNLDQYTGDVGYQIGKDDRLHGYYAIQRDLRRETLSGTSIPGFGDTRQAQRQIFTLNEVHSFGPNLVNEARLGFNRIHITFLPNAKLNPVDFGINSGFTSAAGLPNITVGGVSLSFGGPAGEPQGRGDATVVVSDTASYLRGKHSLKIGGEFRRFYNNNFNSDAGSFTFATPSDFVSGKVTAFSATLGSVTSSIAMGNLGLFVQDNFKARQNLTLELGFRYDWNTTPTERFKRFVVFDAKADSLVRVGSGIDQVHHTNNKLFQPRLGFAWDPFKDGKTSVRAAYAILFDQPVSNLVIGLSSNPPLATPVRFTGPGFTTFTGAIAAAKAIGLAPQSVDPNFDDAYVQSWNLNIQRELTPTLGVMAGYFGSKGTHLRISRNINQPRNGVRPFPTLSSSSPLFPGAALGNITEIDSAGNSSYNALWVSVNKRLSHSFQFNTSYTFSKSIDYNSRNGGTFVQDSYNLRGDRALSDFDARHRISIRALYDLPFHGNRLWEGWQLSSIVQAQSGNPVNILAGNPSGLNIASFTGNGTVRPDVIGPIQVLGHPTQWFTNTVCDPRSPCPAGSVFALPVGTGNVFHFGNLGRNVIRGSGFSDVDLSVLKNTKITEGVRLQFRAEFFDIFNHANFGQPGNRAQVGSTTFGVVTDTRFPTGDSGSSRQIQFALKLVF